MKHINLTIISTQVPDDKSEMNLLLFNNGNDINKMDVKKIVDSLLDKKMIQPLVVVGVHGNEKEDYGMSGLVLHEELSVGSRADKYNNFVMNELYPFIKKRTAIRKFRSVAICGNSLGGISAFDIAWQHNGKIARVGIFSGDFDYAGILKTGRGPLKEVFKEILLSRKRPKLEYWLYTGSKNDSAIMNNTSAFVEIIEKKNAGTEADIKSITDKNGNNDISSWRHHFAEFLLWAFGK